MSNSMDKKRKMSKSGMKSIIVIRSLVGMNKINRISTFLINSLISILNVAELTVATRSAIKKHQTMKN